MKQEYMKSKNSYYTKYCTKYGNLGRINDRSLVTTKPQTLIDEIEKDCCEYE